MFLQRKRLGPAVLDGIAQPVQRPHARIAAPGEYETIRRTHADQLVVDQIRGHPHQREVPTLLPQHLVGRRERDEMRKALHCHAIPVMDVRGNGLGEGTE
jgi:hypothetical protein